MRRGRLKIPEPIHISAILEEYLKKKGMFAELEMMKAMALWDDVVGVEISKRAHTISLEDGVLMVRVKSSVWRNELSFQRENIRKKINNIMGKEIISEIKLV